MSVFCQALRLFSLYCNLQALHHGSRFPVSFKSGETREYSKENIYHSRWHVMMSLARKSTGKVYDWGASALSSSEENPPVVSRHTRCSDTRDTMKMMKLVNLQRLGGDGGGGGRSQKGSINELEAGDNLIKKTAARWEANSEGVSLRCWTDASGRCEQLISITAADPDRQLWVRAVNERIVRLRNTLRTKHAKEHASCLNFQWEHHIWLYSELY